jgi:protein transport protein SEC31
MYLAMMILVPTAPSVVFGQPSPDPTGKVPATVELPVDISIDIVKGDEDTPPTPEITIHLLNEKSGREFDLDLPKTNAPSEHPSSATAHAPFETPPVAPGPVVEAPPVEAPPFEAPPVEAPPVATPPVDVPVADLPPVETPPLEAPPLEAPPSVEPPPVDVPTVEAPPVDTPPISLPPTVGAS